MIKFLLNLLYPELYAKMVSLTILNRAMKKFGDEILSQRIVGQILFMDKRILIIFSAD